MGKYIITRESIQAMLDQKFGKRYELAYLRSEYGWYALDAEARQPKQYLGRNLSDAYVFVANCESLGIGGRLLNTVKSKFRKGLYDE